MHEVLVNRLGGLSLPKKSVVRLTDRPDMTLDVYRGRKTTMQQQQQRRNYVASTSVRPHFEVMWLLGRLGNLRLYILFNSLLVISGLWVGDNERLCSIEPRLRLKRSPPQVGLELGTAG